MFGENSFTEGNKGNGDSDLTNLKPSLSSFPSVIESFFRDKDFYRRQQSKQRFCSTQPKKPSLSSFPSVKKSLFLCFVIFCKALRLLFFKELLKSGGGT
jgi:hypothetical protein